VIPIVVPAIGLLFAFFITRGASMSSAPATSVAPGQIDSSASFRDVASGLTRFAATMIGNTLLVLSLLICIAAVSDLPGLFASGVLDQQMSDRLTQTFGTSNWPQLLNEFGAVCSFVLGALAVFFLTMARRSRGGLHVVRAIIGILVLFGAAMALGQTLPDWASFVPQTSPAASADWYFRHVNGHNAFLAMLIGAAGYTILIWPARRAMPKAQPASEGAAK
jgi:hypothetical protein